MIAGALSSESLMSDLPVISLGCVIFMIVRSVGATSDNDPVPGKNFADLPM